MRCLPLLATVLALGFSSSYTLAQSDVNLIAQRRKADLAQFPTPSQLGSIPTWLASQKSDGTWSDVDYTAGCTARECWYRSETSVRLLIPCRASELADTGTLEQSHHPRERLVGLEPLCSVQLHRLGPAPHGGAGRHGLLVRQ